MTKAPSPARVPAGSVKPPMTNSCPRMHLVFTPPGVAASAVRQITALGDDAFEAKLAGLREERFALSFDMIRVADAPALRPAHQRAEPSLPLLERQVVQAFAFETEQIEHEIDERRARPPSGDHLLQVLKARAAVGQHHGHLAVDQRVARAEPDGSVADLGERSGPVPTAAADERRAAALDAAADPVAVELDLMEPLVARGRRRHERGKLRAVLTVHHRPAISLRQPAPYPDRRGRGVERPWYTQALAHGRVAQW